MTPAWTVPVPSLGTVQRIAAESVTTPPETTVYWIAAVCGADQRFQTSAVCVVARTWRCVLSGAVTGFAVLVRLRTFAACAAATVRRAWTAPADD